MKLKHLLFTCFTLTIALYSFAQIPKPSETFGFEPGADYKMATYDQMLAYYEKLDAATNRVQMIEIGKSVHGRPIKLVFISSEENMKSLDKWRGISEKLARAKIDEAEALQLAKDGKAIVWFDGGMHATEKAHAQMTPALIYRIVSEESDEMKQIRDNVITLVVPVINPDGLDIVAAWYKANLGTPYETTNPPVLYQEYVGHDNNRDWFMGNMPETKSVMKVLYSQWYPQIIHNHHQSAPSWARIFIPPFRSPVNDKIHPGVTTGVNLVGAAMANRFVAKNMPGAISQTNYEMWWNGGMRTAPYYHNMIGILTETAHTTPTPRFYPPDSIPSTVGGKTPNGTEIFYPYPWKGGESHFRDAVNYMIEASMALLNLAAVKKENFLYGIYDMGKDAINNANGAYAYVIPKDQWDKGEAENLVNIMQLGGIEVESATSKFTANGVEYPEGSYILYGAQSFRPYLEDLMEKQNYPDLYQYPGGPPISPYDLTGWTLPMQMGVKVDRIAQPFQAKTQKLNKSIQITPGKVNKGSYGYALTPKENQSYHAVNKLVQAGESVMIAQSEFSDGKINFPAGTFLIETGNTTEKNLSGISQELGVTFNGIKTKPGVAVRKLNKIKVGLYKSWIANIDEGWTRWVLEQYDFDFDTLHNEDIASGDLTQYSAIIFPSQNPGSIINGYMENTMPEKYVGGIGTKGVLAIENYAKEGGVLIFFDDATDLAIDQFGLPVNDITSRLSSSQFFVPGSLIRTTIDIKSPLGFGMQPEVAVSFQRSKAFDIEIPDRINEGGRENTEPAPKPDVKVVAHYASSNILMSGWGKGQERYLKNKGAMMDAGYGNGRIILFGFRPQFRGQPRGTYKLIFNSIYLGSLEDN